MYKRPVVTEEMRAAGKYPGHRGRALRLSPFKTAMHVVKGVMSYYKFYTIGIYKAKQRCLPRILSVSKILTTLFRVIRDHYIQNEGGVYLRCLGYFCTVIDPHRRDVAKKNNAFLIPTNGYRYRSLVLPDMTECFVIKLHTSLVLQKKKALGEGLRYKFLHREVRERRAQRNNVSVRDSKFYGAVDLQEITKHLKFTEAPLGASGEEEEKA